MGSERRAEGNICSSMLSCKEPWREGKPGLLSIPGNTLGTSYIPSPMVPRTACHLSLFYEWRNEVILGKNKKSNLGLADPAAHESY